MCEERNYRYELYLKEKENKELLEVIKELKEYQYDSQSKQIIREMKESKQYPSFVWAFCLTVSLYLFVAILKDIAPVISKWLSDKFFYFEMFGMGCAFYYLVYWLYTRKISKKRNNQ